MRIYLQAVLIVYLHAVTGEIGRISAISRDDFFPDNTLRYIPIRIQFHIINPARQQRSFIFHTPHTDTHLQNRVRFFVDCLQHECRHIGYHIFLSFIQCILPTCPLHIYQQTIPVIIRSIRFPPSIYTNQFFLHLAIKRRRRLCSTKSSNWICTQ